MRGKRLEKQLTGVALLDYSPGLLRIQSSSLENQAVTCRLPPAINLKAQHLIAGGVRHALTPGMQVTAEIHLGTRTILEYLLSPVLGAFQEAVRER